MDLTASSDPSTAEKPSSSFSAPAAAPSPSKTGFTGEIETPEKKTAAPHRAINRNMAFSIKDVRRFSQRLQAPDGHGVADRAAAGSGDELSFPEEKLVSGSSSKIPKTKPLVKLPEKYEALAEFFNCMETSIRLHRLKGSITTFSSISSSIQHMTGRRFTHMHLAQLKFIFPESIAINKVVTRDEASCCMKPELQVFVKTDAVGNEKRKGETAFTSLRRMFRERLAEFSKEHPEEDDVPEDMLPHPFGWTDAQIQPRSSQTPPGSSVASAVSNLQDLQLAVPSHMPRSFKRWFSQKIPLDNVDSKRASTDGSPDYVASPVKCTSRPSISEKSRLCPPVLPSLSCLSPKCLGEKAEAYSEVDGGSSEGSLVLESTPAKPVSTPLMLMTETPELRTEKRFLPSSSYDTPPDHNTWPARKKLKRSVRAKLSLSPEKSSKQQDAQVMEVEDPVNILPRYLLQSIREKEITALADKEPAAVEARRRQKIVTRLPETFDLIRLLFHSGNHSVVTKKELIHKIITGHLKIVDKGEIEEQLKMLQGIVPDWIWMKTTINGDPLFCVDKKCNADEIRRKIVDSGRRTHLDIC